MKYLAYSKDQVCGRFATMWGLGSELSSGRDWEIHASPVTRKKKSFQLTLMTWNTARATNGWLHSCRLSARTYTTYRYKHKPTNLKVYKEAKLYYRWTFVQNTIHQTRFRNLNETTIKGFGHLEDFNKIFTLVGKWSEDTDVTVCFFYCCWCKSLPSLVQQQLSFHIPIPVFSHRPMLISHVIVCTQLEHPPFTASINDTPLFASATPY